MTEEATTSDVVTDDLNNDVATTTEGKPIIVGEHSVYKSLEDLVKGKQEADAYIAKITLDLKTAMATIDDLKQKADIRQQLQEYRKGNTMTDETQAPVETTNSQLTDDAIREIALKAMQEANAAQVAAKNLSDCKGLVAAKAGDADLAIKNKAEELGVTEQDMLDMASNKPQLFKRLFDVQDSTRSLNFVNGGSRPEAAPLNGHDNVFDTLTKTPNKCYDKNFMANLITEALKNPSILGDSEWKVIK